MEVMSNFYLIQGSSSSVQSHNSYDDEPSINYATTIKIITVVILCIIFSRQIALLNIVCVLVTYENLSTQKT